MTKRKRGGEKRQKPEEGVLGRKTGKDEGTKKNAGIAAHLTVVQMNLLNVNPLPHKPENDFYHMY